jgi:NAD(P)-dependent dehydrogenase (short-subunit alcohol dehydrogenase family)
MDLNGRTALVTGAGRGLGWGVANAFARAGARVCATDVDPAGVERAVGDIRAARGEALGCHLDVADPTAFRGVVDEVMNRWGRVDVLVHCAIYMPLVRFEALGDDAWRRQLDVGLGGFYNGVRAVWDPMVAQGGGHLMGVASGSSVRGYVDEVAYCTVKHAQEGFVKALSLEAQERGIGVNTVGPGAPIKTTRLTWEELEALPQEAKRDWADPVELGRAFVWLASQPPTRFTGLRFDAGRIVETLDREGEGFAFEAEKVTMYPEDFRARVAWREEQGRG